MLLVEANGLLGITEEISMPLSMGIRLVSHSFLEVKWLDYFYWIEDGKIQFELTHEGYSEAVPDEFMETMERIDSIYPLLTDLHDGPAFLLAERSPGSH